MAAYLSYIIVRDATAPPIINSMEVKSKAHGEAIGLAIKQLLLQASKVYSPVYFYWVVTTDEPQPVTPETPEKVALT